MRGSSPPPVQATYSEALADSLRAQVDLLRGTGEFEDTGGLAELLRDYEAPVRQQTAQIDTDVLRQTLLGSERKFQVEQDPETGKFGITGAEVVKNEQGEPQTAGDGRYQIVQIKQGDLPTANEFGTVTVKNATTPTYGIIDTQTGGLTGTVGGDTYNMIDDWKAQGGKGLGYFPETYRGLYRDKKAEVLKQVTEKLNTLRGTIADAGGDVDAAQEEVAKQFTFENPYTGEQLEEGETITIREGDGMVDLLGDRRNVQETRRLSQIEQGEEFVRQNPEFKALYDQVQTSGDSSNPFFGLTEAEAGRKVLADAGGDAEKIKETYGISNLSIPEFAAVDTGRQAGFDEQGNFLGSAALAEDIQAGQLSRQRERDIADVERLSGRFSNIMDDFKPATSTGIADAQTLLKAQATNLTGGGKAVTVPSGSTFGGKVTPGTMTAATVADPTKLQANTQFNQELASDPNQDTLRQALLGQAKSALDDGLTAREQRQIEQAARARQTATGRIFDPSSTIQEAQAVIEEDRNRQMQNRAFAQSVMGQEAGLQTGDIGRAMGQESEQAGLQQRADLAQAQMDQQAAAFGADAATRAAFADQAQQQQASQFDIGAQMDAERLNEQLRQQGVLGYIDAVARTAQLEDQYTLDPFRAILGRGGGGSLQAGQGVLGSASYGLQSGPQYLNPEAGLGYQSNLYTNQANMYGAQQAADATRFAGIMSGLGNLGGGFLAGR
jgi:hypothetical protein